MPQHTIEERNKTNPIKKKGEPKEKESLGSMIANVIAPGKLGMSLADRITEALKKLGKQK